MRMTMQVLYNFYENVGMSMIEAFVIVVETKGVPRQQIQKWCRGNKSENDAMATNRFR